ncbi:unnamed protein product [Agarophyton chilense]
METKMGYLKNSTPRLLSRRKNMIMDDEDVSEKEVIIVGETRVTGGRTRSSKGKKRKASEAPVDSREWVPPPKKRQNGAGAGSSAVLNTSTLIWVLKNMPKKELKSLLREKKIFQLCFSEAEDEDAQPKGVFAGVRFEWEEGCIEEVQG